MNLVVYSTSQPFKRHLAGCLETSFEFHSRLQAPNESSQQLYLLHLSSMKSAGLEWLLKHVSSRPVTVAVCSDLPEIGEMLDVSLNTVASRYRYGLERLRKSLDSSRRAEDI